MTTPRKAPYPLWRRLVKIALWAIMAAVLTVAATLICTVSMLRPERLTPIALKAANSALDARVDASRVELGLRSSFPFLTLRIDSLSIVSTQMQAAPAAVRAVLPAYADTLLHMRSLSGGISLAALARGEISLSDIIIDGAGVNIVTAPDGRCNYTIVPPTPDEPSDTAALNLPAISLTRFELRHPQPVRYYNALDSDSIIVRLRPAALASDGAPHYTLSFGGNLHMPMLAAMHLAELPFAIDGGLRWDPADPLSVSIHNVSASAAFVSTRLSADISLGGDAPVLRTLDFALDPVAADTLLACLPDSMRRAIPMLAALRTDAAISAAVRLTRPFDTATDSIPYADIDLTVEPCAVSLGRAAFRDVEARLHAQLRGNDPAAAILDIERLHVSGPATALTLSGTLSDIGADPYFDGHLQGFSDLRRLPAQLLDLVQGSLQGTMHADLRLSGRPSMFSRDGFHRLLARGTLDGRDLYWLADDTVRAAYVRRASLTFGTRETDAAGTDSLLQARIAIDSLSYLDHDINVRSTSLSLGFGASNRRLSADTTAIIPMGGGLSMATLRVQSLSDSVGVVARNLGGTVVMRRYHGAERRPEFLLDIHAARLATGSPDMRFLLTDATIHTDAHMLPPTRRQLLVRHTADSLRSIHPELPPDSVYALAVRMHRRAPGRHTPRVHSETIDDGDREIIDWGTSTGLARLLTRWQLSGTVSAERAGLYTPMFPLRNRVRNFNLAFSTDSIVLQGVQYKGGHSDFTLSGRITNIRRALTSRTGRQPLRMHLDLVSDTIDINQLAAATFAGSAYSQRRAAGHAGLSGIADMDTDDIPDTTPADTATAPLLIPGNIDAEIGIRANNVIYSDLLLHNLTGTALMLDGRLNLHDLSAAAPGIGSVDLSALYSAPAARDMQFGFGMVLRGFNIERFLRLVPAIDSIMPLMRDIGGIIDANIAATVDVRPDMDLDLSTLNAAVRLEGDSLRLLDGDTYRTMAKWLMFKDKTNNVIDSMSVELLIENGMMELFPFVFNLDRYRLGVQGYNDMALNFDYHVAVLKSPLPFRFGITLKGNPDDFKVRLGKARFNERTAVTRPAIVDTTRVNLLKQIEGVFRRGVRNSRLTPLHFATRPEAQTIDLNADTLSRADSLALMREGLIPQMK